MKAQIPVKTLFTIFALSILIAVQPATAMIALKDRLGRKRPIPHEEDWMRDARVRVEAEKFWARDLARILPAALMPHLNNHQLVDLVGMKASEYYPRQVREGLASAPQDL